ncbi:AbrB/MazE/SpoVT family DNA-binding domain-containing protein [Sporosarcina sp. UB5]|uniref:AbrB/MazE/SpoVT family DNA-binding domain-containing protein n=1 Tax=Sporosarcina sp. UB5 TaxID=3047463 RepID=UPI003D7B946E
MRSLGIIRKVDHLGRIVIPKELRTTLQIDKGAPMEIFVDDDMIILRKYVVDSACIVTGDITNKNKKLSNGMYISPKGAEILLREIQEQKTWE